MERLMSLVDEMCKSDSISVSVVVCGVNVLNIDDTVVECYYTRDDGVKLIFDDMDLFMPVPNYIIDHTEELELDYSKSYRAKYLDLGMEISVQLF